MCYSSISLFEDYNRGGNIVSIIVKGTSAATVRPANMSMSGYAFAAWVSSILGFGMWGVWAWWPLQDDAVTTLPSLLKLPWLRYWALALPAWGAVAFLYTR